MSQSSQTIEAATTALTVEQQPDSKTRRYDRQLRLWAVTGQNALESSRILVISGTATSTSVLKNLVLPGIGHFTILDDGKVTPEDAGNNFFLEGHESIGKSRAEEAVRLLGELNDGVEGKANTDSLENILSNNMTYLASFTLIIAHNLETKYVERLSELLWGIPAAASLVVVRSAGFLAEFFIQYKEHPIVESHSESAPSLRIDKPFPALLEYAMNLDLDGMDPTEHAHIPYVIILVRALEDWKKAHNGIPPKTSSEKSAFKDLLGQMKKKPDEENFDEALAQAYRAWTETTVPSEIAELFSDPGLQTLTPTTSPFFHLLAALRDFSAQSPHTLPLSSTLPDMKSDTKQYIHLQKLYKARAEEEKAELKKLIKIDVAGDEVDTFVKNAHGLRMLRGKKWGAFDQDKAALAEALGSYPKETASHLAISALFTLRTKQPKAIPTTEALTTEVHLLVGQDVELPEEWEIAAGEIVRAPTADIPNMAAFLGGLVAQEAIKMITRQYVPINGYCVVDLVDTWTGVVG